MARMLGNTEHAFDSAKSQFWVVDANVSSIISQELWISARQLCLQGLFFAFDITHVFSSNISSSNWNHHKWIKDGQLTI